MFLGFSSGLPLALSGSTLLVWMREAGVDLGTIGLFALVGTPYTVKFLWAPLVDALDVPMLSPLLGRRRGWLVFSQLLLMAAIVSSASATRAPRRGLVALRRASGRHRFGNAGHRDRRLPRRKPAGKRTGRRHGLLRRGLSHRHADLDRRRAVSGERFRGSGLAKQAAWHWGYVAMAGLVLIGTLTALLATEPGRRLRLRRPMPRQQRFARVVEAAVGAFKDFLGIRACFRHAGLRGAVQIHRCSLRRHDCAVRHRPRFFAQRICGHHQRRRPRGDAARRILPAASSPARFRSPPASGSAAFCSPLANLVFCWQALIGHEHRPCSPSRSSVENFTSAIGTVIFVAYLSALCRNPLHTATQYALLTALAAVGRTYLSSGAGFIAEQPAGPGSS